jgi:hypothetical protein
MASSISRREFCKDAALLGAAVAAWRDPSASAADATPSEMPKIKLGGLEVSRLILGSNPFFAFTHGNPQASPKVMKEFYSNERIMAVMDAAAAHGITAVWAPCYDHWIQLWNEYQEKGGKLKIWIAQPDRLPMEPELMAAIRNGAKAVCIQGERIDSQVGRERWDVVRSWLELIKSHKLPAGMASHTVKTHLAAEEHGMPTDFYHQTLYRPDKYVRQGLDESLATIEKLAKPVVAYKVLGAGRILPKDTLPEIFKRLRPKDGICLGMFPKERDEVAENAALTCKLGGIRD